MSFKERLQKHSSNDTPRERSNEPISEAPKHQDDESNWLISYADMMTLLCGFFIMLFSMSKLDAPQYDGFKEAMVKQFGGEYISPRKDLAKFTAHILDELGLEHAAVVRTDPYGVSVAFESTIFFDTLSSDVTPKGTQILTQFIEELSKRQISENKNYKIIIEGHTDGRPIVGGIYPSNWELSGARAARVIRMFLDHGFSPRYLTAIGYADTHPQAEARNAKGKWDDLALGRNRRVVLRILEPSVDFIPFPSEAPAPVSANTAH